MGFLQIFQSQPWGDPEGRLLEGRALPSPALLVPVPVWQPLGYVVFTVLPTAIKLQHRQSPFAGKETVRVIQ